MKLLTTLFTLMTVTGLLLPALAKDTQIAGWIGKDSNNQPCSVVVNLLKQEPPEIQGTYQDSTGPKNFKVYLAMFDSPDKIFQPRRPNYFEGSMSDTNLSQKIVIRETENLKYIEATVSVAVETGAPVIIRKCSLGIPPKKED